MLLATFMVSSANPSGPGSLEQAILDDNGATANPANPNVIDFSIGTGTQTIAIPSNTTLTTISQPTEILGNTQPGSVPNTASAGDNAPPAIVLNGGGFGGSNVTPSLGLTFGPNAAGSVVQGLGIENFYGGGISINGGNVTVVNCLVQGNASVGIEIFDAPGSQVISTSVDATTTGAGSGDNIAVAGSSTNSPSQSVTLSFLAVSNADGTGISIADTNNVTIHGDTVESNQNGGVVLTGSTSPTLNDDVVEKNQNGGISLATSPSAQLLADTIGGVAVNSGTTLGNQKFGLQLMNSDGATLGDTGTGDGLFVFGNAGQGVSLIDSDNVSLVDANASNNVGAGVSISGSSHVSIQNGVFADTLGIGITAGVDSGTDLPSTSLSLNSTVVLGSTDVGILVSGVASNGTVVTTAENDTFTNVISESDSATGSVQNGGLKLLDSMGDQILGGTYGGASGAGNRLFGIDLEGAPGTTIGGSAVGAGVTITNNTGPGVLMTASAGVSILNDTLTGNVGGLSAANASNSLSVVSTTLSGNADGGGIVSGTSQVQFLSDTISNNSGYGVSLNSASSVSGSNLTVSGNTGAGVEITLSNAVTIAGSSIDGNLDGGVVFSQSSGSSLVSSTLGATTGNGRVGIAIEGSPQVTIGGAVAGSGVTVASTGGDGIDIPALNGNSDQTLLLNVTVTRSNGVGIAVGSTQGVVVGTPTAPVTVSNSQGDGVDFRSAAVDAIFSGSSSLNAGVGVALNGVSDTLSGATVASNLSSGVSGVGSASVITGSVIQRNTGAGVVLSGVQGATLQNVTIGGATSGSANSGDGLELLSCPSPTISGVTTESNTGAGANLSKSPSASISNLISQLNSAGGILLSESGSSSIQSSTVSSNSRIGVLVAGSPSVSLGGVVVNGTSGDGIDLSSANNTSSDNTSILNTSVSGNSGVGISVGASKSVILGQAGAPVTVTGNSGNGVEIRPASPSAVFVGQSSANLGDGIDVFGPLATISGSTITSNHGFGITALNTPSVTIGGTTSGSGNTISGNLFDGISISDSGSNSTVSATGTPLVAVEGNTLEYNGFATVTLGGSTLAVKSQDSNGITVFKSTPVSISDNVISNNSSDGISVSDSTGSTEVPFQILGNSIGVGPDGISPLGNLNEGIVLSNSVGVVVEADALGKPNVVSANLAGGIEIDGNGATTGDQVLGNEIGTNATGTAEVMTAAGLNALASNPPTSNVSTGQPFGVFINDAGGNVIGNTAGGGNLISGQNSTGSTAIDSGVIVSGQGSIANYITGNTIGTTLDKTGSIGNDVGIYIDGSPGNAVFSNFVSGGYQADIQVVGGADSGQFANNGNAIIGNTIGAYATSNYLPASVPPEFAQRVPGTNLGGQATFANSSPATAATVDGILLLSAPYTSVTNNTISLSSVGIQANSLFPKALDGVLTGAAPQVVTDPTTVKLQAIAPAVSQAVAASTPGTITQIVGNTLLLNDTGILVDQSQFLDISSNVVSQSLQAGIVLTGQLSLGNLVSGNHLDFDQDGIYLESSPANEILMNTIGSPGSNSAGHPITPNSSGAGIYLFGPTTELNQVVSDSVSAGSNAAYGVVFVNTPQLGKVANFVTTKGPSASSFSGKFTTGSPVLVDAFLGNTDAANSRLGTNSETLPTSPQELNALSFKKSTKPKSAPIP
jgi:parallel beta-helix repeat protein